MCPERTSLLQDSEGKERVGFGMDARLEDQNTTTTTRLEANHEGNKNPQEHPPSSRLRVLISGQLIALSLALANAASSTATNRFRMSVPTFQTFIMYFLLSFHLWIKYRDQKIEQGRQRDVETTGGESTESTQLQCIRSTTGGAIQTENINDNGDGTASVEAPKYRLPFTSLKLKVPWWTYCLIAFLDVEANNLTVRSLRYTSLTSTTLLNSLSIASTMVASRIILKRCFRGRHYMGVFFCIIGGSLTVFSDAFLPHHEPSDAAATSPSNSSAETDAHILTTMPSYTGDLLAIAGSMIYGLNDTIAEYLVKNVDRLEYLGMNGLFAAIISACQIPFTEWDNLMNLFHTRNSSIVLVLVWYVGALLYNYIATSKFLLTADATLLNLSLQTSNLWAVIFSVVAEHFVPSWIFYVAVVITVAGVCFYESVGLLNTTGYADNGNLPQTEDLAAGNYGSVKTKLNNII